MSIHLEVPSDIVSIRIVPSVLGKARLVVSTDIPEYKVSDPRSRRAHLRATVQRFVGKSRILNLRKPSLIRSNGLVIASLCTAWPAFRHPSGIFAMWMPLAAIVAMIGTADTCRHLRRRWDWHHGGVLLMIYADLMTVTLLAFMAILRIYQA